MNRTLLPTIRATLIATLAVLSGLTVLRAAPAAAHDDHGTATPAAASTVAHYVGPVAGTDAFLAVVVDDQNHILAYVCDSTTTAEWFTGAVALDGLLDVRSAGGMHLLARIEANTVEGWITIEGAEHRISLEVAMGNEAGLYRAEETVAGVEYVGGWIVLADGRERGAVKNQSTGFIDLNSDLARPSEPVDEFIEQGVGI